MAKITRIKASDTPQKKEESEDTAVVRRRLSVKDEKTEKKRRQKQRKTEKTKIKDPKDAGKKPFWLFRPFVALGHYLRDSWRELRQVRWPNRKTTWKMLIAVILYAALFMVIITLLDLFFTWLFNLMLNK